MDLYTRGPLHQQFREVHEMVMKTSGKMSNRTAAVGPLQREVTWRLPDAAAAARPQVSSTGPLTVGHATAVIRPLSISDGATRLAVERHPK
jgi:hypothetical protein